MKLLIVLFFGIITAESSFARGCTENLIEQGCHSEEEDCDVPTHYQCNVCVCPEPVFMRGPGDCSGGEIIGGHCYRGGANGQRG